MEKLKYAIHYGADAVYLAGKSFGMRTASANFTGEELRTAIEYAHKKNVRVYVTVNTLPRNEDLLLLPEYLELLSELSADAIILSDLGVLSLAKKYAPTISIHVSTQASVVNHLSASMWHSMGADRIVLARELSLEEIKEIRAKTPKELSLEAFVHGAMCMSYSGRCLLSQYMASRDPNRGNCAQACRWKYHLVEELRPGEYLPIIEDDKGTFIFNSKDLCMINHIPELIDAGIESLKIEGRVKTFYYVAAVTNAYRRAIDIIEGKNGQWTLPEELRSEVLKVSHREYCTGFYFRNEDIKQVYEDATSIREWDVVAVVNDCDQDGFAICTQKNRFCKGAVLELLEPFHSPKEVFVSELYDESGNLIDSAPHPQMNVKLKLPHRVLPMAILRQKRD
ncbi:MAG: U32 family peptidase [Clostridiales bacterium]|nr:U32 family peptidase [Clostridiales bacterium]